MIPLTAPVSPLAHEQPTPIRKYVSLIVVLGLGIALGGYLKGIHETPALDLGKQRQQAHADGTIPAAVTYSEVPTELTKANQRNNSSLDTLKFHKHGVFDNVVRTDEMKMAALMDRSRNRAYDTAPPVVPHGILQMSASNCIACHGEGIVVQDRIATKMSHQYYANCTQCHVEAQRTELTSNAPDVMVNHFLGQSRAGPGTRAWLGAPPTIPHTTWMRQDCTSCHGLVARAGIRTTHPWLTNCTQCHSPSAQLDQSSFGRN